MKLIPILLFVFTVPLLISGESCAWCEAGDSACDQSFVATFDQDLFPISVSNEMNNRRFPYFRPSLQQPLDSDRMNEEITSAIIVQHGDGRNGQDYCSYAANAVLKWGGSLDTTMVISPQIYETGDSALNTSSMLWWNINTEGQPELDGGERDWKWGGNSTSDLSASISSFQVLDELIIALADHGRYPNMRRIVLVGHSSGGQFVQRYALFSKVGKDGVLSAAVPSDVTVSYYVANPSSTTYLGPERPVTSDQNCDFCVNTTITSELWQFAVPDFSSSESKDCSDTYNTYGYGLDGPLPDYPKGVTTDAAVAQYAARDVFYMSGESDICDLSYMTDNNCTECTAYDGGLDTSCEAYTQGWCRMSRLHAYAQYVNRFFYKRPVHSLLSVPDVGHSGCGMLQSPQFFTSAIQK